MSKLDNFKKTKTLDKIPWLNILYEEWGSYALSWLYNEIKNLA